MRAVLGRRAEERRTQRKGEAKLKKRITEEKQEKNKKKKRREHKEKQGRKGKKYRRGSPRRADKLIFFKEMVRNHNEIEAIKNQILSSRQKEEQEKEKEKEKIKT